MFVFLSKLLPIFIYPLGLSITFLLVAVFLRRSHRWERICLLVCLGILLLAGNAWVPTTLTRALEWQYLPLETYPQAEVIVLLGGSTASAQYPRQIVEISSAGDRILYAAHLYHEGVAPILLLSGGNIPWMNEGDTPANDMAQILEMLGVPENALWLETDSRNTYENALFTRQILADKGIDHIILVTSAMHMPRAVSLFENQGIKVIPAPADYNVTQEDWKHLWEPDLTRQIFNILPTVGNLSNTTSAMKEFIGILIYGLRGWL